MKYLAINTPEGWKWFERRYAESPPAILPVPVDVEQTYTGTGETITRSDGETAEIFVTEAELPEFLAARARELVDFPAEVSAVRKGPDVEVVLECDRGDDRYRSRLTIDAKTRELGSLSYVLRGWVRSLQSGQARFDRDVELRKLETVQGSQLPEWIRDRPLELIETVRKLAEAGVAIVGESEIEIQVLQPRHSRDSIALLFRHAEEFAILKRYRYHGRRKSVGE